MPFGVTDDESSGETLELHYGGSCRDESGRKLAPSAADMAEEQGGGVDVSSGADGTRGRRSRGALPVARASPRTSSVAQVTHYEERSLWPGWAKAAGLALLGHAFPIVEVKCTKALPVGTWLTVVGVPVLLQGGNAGHGGKPALPSSGIVALAEGVSSSSYFVVSMLEPAELVRDLQERAANLAVWEGALFCLAAGCALSACRRHRHWRAAAWRLLYSLEGWVERTPALRGARRSVRRLVRQLGGGAARRLSDANEAAAASDDGWATASDDERSLSSFGASHSDSSAGVGGFGVPNSGDECDDGDEAGEGGGTGVDEGDDDSELCCVCLRRPRDAIFASCGHRACCVRCARRVAARARAECPICRAPLTSNSQPVIRVFDG